jgi:hypothetical protein
MCLDCNKFVEEVFKDKPLKGMGTLTAFPNTVHRIEINEQLRLIND